MYSCPDRTFQSHFAELKMTVDRTTFNAVVTGVSPKRLLLIKGRVKEPTTSWAVLLIQARQQVKQSKTLFLRLIEIRPAHLAGVVVTDYPVTFEQMVEDRQYREVEIQTDKQSFTIPVQEQA
jgi:hypothetical protein